jgi:putative tryptophan/tyrosine transport system substrate-binding protein
MRRREFITLFGGATAALTLAPLALRAQQAAMPVIGYLHSASLDAFGHPVAAFRKGLTEVGYVEGQNLAIEYRWAEGHFDRLPGLAADLVRRDVAVLVAQGGATSAVAAKAATTTIPIVFSSGGDPVALGVVSSLSHPGGNATGVSLLTAALGSKRLEILHQVVPNANVIAALVNPNNATIEGQLKDLQDGARAFAVQLKFLNASSAADIDVAFAALVQSGIGALVVGSDPFYLDQRNQLVALAARHKISAIYEWRDYADAGGLMSYGTSLADAYRQVGVYTGRVLKGEKPADLPVIQSTKVELVINLKTAKTLGITFPLSLLGRADEVIE